MESRFKDLGWKILDLLFPPSCAGCGKWGSRYCAECITKTNLIQTPICKTCGEPVSDIADSICGNCIDDDIYFEAVRSWARFEPPLQNAIHRLKYKNDIGLAEVLVEHLYPILVNMDWEIDLVVPVPLDQDRLKARGYNQSSLLGKSLAKKVKITFSDKAIQRKKITRTQIGLTKEERKDNVRDAFQVYLPVVTGKNILVVDDVITTGATLNACSKELRIAGANVVFGLTVARSLHL